MTGPIKFTPESAAKRTPAKRTPAPPAKRTETRIGGRVTVEPKRVTVEILREKKESR